MGRYPAQPLEEKLAWMRERQRRRREKENREKEKRPAPAPPRVEPSQMLRVKQVAEILGVSIMTVHRWFRKRAVIVQGPQRKTMLIPRRTLDDWIREHTVRSR